MRHFGMLLVVASLLGATSTAYAQGGIGGVGGVGGTPPPGGGGFGGFGGMCGMNGIFGMGGCCGGNISGFPCNFNGFCGFGGCCGGFGLQFTPTQSYSNWSPSPAKTYYYRTLTVHTLAPNEAILEFVLVHHPERAKHFYFYDPVDKKYFGRYTIGARPEQSFSLLPYTSRKSSLKEVPDTGSPLGGQMPEFKHIIRPRPGTTIDPALQNVKLMRPPESIPDALLGLPNEEPTLKKK